LDVISRDVVTIAFVDFYHLEHPAVTNRLVSFFLYPTDISSELEKVSHFVFAITCYARAMQ